jgi:multiple sugar transport system permease protein
VTRAEAEAVDLRAGKTGHRRALLSEPTKGFLFVLPALVLLASVMGFPMIGAALQSVNLIWVDRPAPTLAAYQLLMQDPAFRHALANTVLFVGATVSVHLAAGLGVALLLNLELRWKWLFRVAALLPWTVPDVIGGLIWRFMFDPLAGLINSVLITAGLITNPVDWLGTPVLAFLCLILGEGWRAYPFIMLILLAGLQAIPRQLYEAAAIDGATPRQSLVYITLPNLRTMFIIALVLDAVWECRVFGMVFSMTGGGPGDATQVLSLLTYRENFEFFNTAYAAAIAVTLACIMLLVSLPYLRLTMKQRI